MNRKEFVDFIAERNAMSKVDAELTLSIVLDSIGEALRNRETVKLTGFGTFEVKERKSRIGRNPHNPDETYVIDESVAPVFRAGKVLKEAIK